MGVHIYKRHYKSKRLVSFFVVVVVLFCSVIKGDSTQFGDVFQEFRKNVEELESFFPL